MREHLSSNSCLCVCVQYRERNFDLEGFLFIVLCVSLIAVLLEGFMQYI